MTRLPNDPILFLSTINMNLRDFYPSLDALCEDLNLNKEDVLQKLASIEYEYDEKTNQFI